MAEYADAWHSFGDAASLRERSAILAEHCETVGRPASAVERSIGVSAPPERVADDLVAAGATLFTIGASGPDYDLELAAAWVRWRDERARG